MVTYLSISVNKNVKKAREYCYSQTVKLKRRNHLRPAELGDETTLLGEIVLNGDGRHDERPAAGRPDLILEFVVRGIDRRELLARRVTE